MLNKRRESQFWESLSARMLRDLTGRKGALLTGRASAAIWATLRAYGFSNRPVLIPANTCYIVLWVVLHSGNIPVLVDVDPLTGNITPETLDACGIHQPAAIIPCHLYGLPAPVAAICKWAQERGAIVIEDASLAVGARIDGRPAGAWGDVSVFSFGHGKIIDIGLGGALLTDDSALLAEAKRLLGGLPLYDKPLARLSDQWLQIYWALHQFETATPGLAQVYPTLFDLYGKTALYRAPSAIWRALPDALDALTADRERRESIARVYDDRLSTIGRTLPRPKGSILWRYPLLVPAAVRDDLLRCLWTSGVEDATRWYPSLHPMAAALAPDVVQPPTPAAERFCAEIINLPLDASVTVERAAQIAGVIAGFWAEVERL